MGRKILKQFFIFIICSLFVFSTAHDSFAKKQKEKTENPRIASLSGENLEMYDALTNQQKKMISEQKVELGYNEWMTGLALGEPYYKSEHHPIYKDYEQVWLYTKNQVDQTVNEEKIIDTQTNWPTKHRLIRIKTCLIGDFFLLFDRGVIEKIVPDHSGKRYGSCTIETREEFIPIVK